MASPETVKRVLKAIAAMFGKHPLWIDDSLKMWHMQLEDIDDRDLVIGCKDLLKKAKKLPTVAQLREVTEANPSTRAGEPVHIAGCIACGGTGQRQLARWWVDEQACVRVFNGVAACDCAKGLQLSMGAFQHWRDVVTAWEQNPATTKVYFASKDEPVLSSEKVLTYEQRQKRAEQAQQQRESNVQNHRD